MAFCESGNIKGQAFFVVVIVGAGMPLCFWGTKENKKRASVDDGLAGSIIRAMTTDGVLLFSGLRNNCDR